MATVVLLSFKDGAREELVPPLKAAGHRVVVIEPKDPDYRLALRGIEGVDIVVVDLSTKAPSGRECAAWIGEQRRFRGVPVLLTGVPDGDEDVTRMKVPLGRRVSGSLIDKAVTHALATAVKPPAKKR